jgi:hypothetical protein
MRYKAVIIIVLAAAMLASCNAWLRPEESGAEFRSLARHMYSSLEQPSCDALKGFDRGDYLKDEADAVRRFEAGVKATPAWGHLVIAREDARYEVERGEGCWSDPSRSWALRHVEMTKDDVEATLPQLTGLVSALGELSIDLGNEPAEMAEFRYLARQMLASITPQCQLTASTSVSDKEVLRPASNAVARLKNELANTRFAVHFAIAEADEAYRRSITLVECVEPSTADPQKISREITAYADQKIEEIRTIMQSD